MRLRRRAWSRVLCLQIRRGHLEGLLEVRSGDGPCDQPSRSERSSSSGSEAISAEGFGESFGSSSSFFSTSAMVSAKLCLGMIEVCLFQRSARTGSGMQAHEPRLSVEVQVHFDVQACVKRGISFGGAATSAPATHEALSVTCASPTPSRLHLCAAFPLTFTFTRHLYKTPRPPSPSRCTPLRFTYFGHIPPHILHTIQISEIELRRSASLAYHVAVHEPALGGEVRIPLSLCLREL